MLSDCCVLVSSSDLCVLGKNDYYITQGVNPQTHSIMSEVQLKGSVNVKYVTEYIHFMIDFY